MKIRKFVAPSVPQALRLVREALGDQAVILSTRQIPGDGGRQQVEITAALDAVSVAQTVAAPVGTAQADHPSRGNLLGRTYGRSAPTELPDIVPAAEGQIRRPRWEADALSQNRAPSRDPAMSSRENGRSNRNVTLAPDRVSARQAASGAPARASSEAADWLASLPSVADRLGPDRPGTDRLASEYAPTDRAAGDPPAPIAEPSKISNAGAEDGGSGSVDQGVPVLRRLRQIEDAVRHMSRHSSSFELPPEVARLGERLRRVGLAEEVTRSLLPQVLRRVQETDQDRRETVLEVAADILYEQLPERADLRIGRQRKVVAFVGPSGSGKTTAIAKIAAGFVRCRRPRPDFVDGEIVIISTDTKRVGALAQARAYADLIDVPLEDVHNADDLARALDRHAEARLVLIDTAGIGAHEVKQREQLRSLLDTADVDEVQVVLDGRTGYDHMLDILDICGGSQPRRLLLSKMDEAMHPGPALSAAIAGKIPSSFYTTGPAIPGGICPGDLRRLVDWVVGRCPSPFAPGGSAVPATPSTGR